MFSINLSGVERKFKSIQEMDAAIEAEKKKPRDPRGKGTKASWDAALDLVNFATRKGVTLTRDEARSRIALAKTKVAGILATKGYAEPSNEILRRQYHQLLHAEAIKLCKLEIK